MNHVYRVIWSVVRQCWIITSELSTARGKSKSVRSSVNYPAVFALMPMFACAQVGATDYTSPITGPFTFHDGDTVTFSYPDDYDESITPKVAAIKADGNEIVSSGVLNINTANTTALNVSNGGKFTSTGDIYANGGSISVAPGSSASFNNITTTESLYIDGNNSSVTIAGKLVSSLLEVREGGTVSFIDGDIGNLSLGASGSWSIPAGNIISTGTVNSSGGYVARSGVGNFNNLNLTGTLTLNGGTINVAGDLTANTTGTAFSLKSALNAKNIDVITTGSKGIGIDGAQNLVRSGTINIKTSGTESHGMVYSGSSNTNYNSKPNFKNVNISTTGDGADAVLFYAPNLAIGGSYSTNYLIDVPDTLSGLSVSGVNSALINVKTDAWRYAPTVTLKDQTFSMAQVGAESWGLHVSGATATATIVLSGNSDTGGTGVWLDRAPSVIRLTDNASMAGSRVKFSNDLRNTLNIATTANSAVVGSLEGLGTLSFASPAGNLILGQNNATSNGSLVDNADFSGRLTNVGSLTKTGSLTQTLSGVNTVGNVTIQGGTLQFSQNGNFTTTGNYTTKSGATTDTGGNGSMLRINGVLTQESGSTLTAMANSSAPAIVANRAVLDGELNLDGFSFSSGGVPAKASAIAIAGSNYTLISTTNGITGNFTNDISQSTNLDYLTQSGGINGNNYTVGFQTAWENGGKSRGTGSFTLAGGSGFEYDTVLADQMAPGGGFNSGWDGKSLTKAGDGTLILSAANTYTGGTALNAGMLQLKGSGTLGDVAAITRVSGGVLDLGTSAQAQAALNQSGGTVQNGTLNLGTYQLTGGTLGANATVKSPSIDLQAGSVAGVLDGGVLKKSGVGTVTMSNAATTVDSVEVQGGTLTFNQSNATFTTTGGYTTQAGANTNVGYNGSTLAVGGTFTQAKDATLNVTLGGTSPKITASTASLDGRLISNFNSGSAPAKSDSVAGTVSTLIRTTGGISGDFTNSQAMQTNLDYLLLDGRLSADGKDYLLGYRMAWDEGGKQFGTGRFTLAAGQTFEVNTVLADQTAPSGGFGSGWDGKSLTKVGDGTLILSAAHTYTGGTTLNAGTLKLAGSGTLGDLGSATTVSGGVLDLGTTTQTQAALNQSGGTVLNGTLNLGAYHLTGGTLGANAIVKSPIIDLQAGNVAGGLDGGTLTKTTADTVTMSNEATTVDSVEVQGGTLTFNQKNATFTTTGDYTTQAGATTGIGQIGSTLAVGGAFTQAKDATLNVTLDGTNPAITATSAALDGKVVFNGYSDIGLAIKASDIVSTSYLLLRTTGGITGALSSVETTVETPDYLKATGLASQDRKEYSLKNIALSWNDGGQTSGTGSFTMAKGTAFNLDTVLADQIMPDSGFNSGWDGKSLTKAGDGSLILSATNTYTGTTTVNGGTLRTDADNTLNSSSDVIINGGTLDLNGHNQTVNRLAGSKGQISLNGANLTTSNNGTADNTQFAGDIVDGNTAGGGLIKTGDGMLTLSGKTGWSGVTRLDAGELVLDGALGGARLVSDVIGVSGTRLSLKNGASLTGTIDPTDVNIGAGSSWNMTGDSLVDNLTLIGTIKFDAPAGHTLTASSWAGNGGTVALNTVLGNDQSATDKIVIDGGKASGNTGLEIHHGNDKGAQTVNGIRVVETKNGATTDAGAFHISSGSDGYRSGKDTIAAGAYDYSLIRGGAGGTADDWYLVSQLSYRPETGAYLNNKQAASTMQFHSLHDRSDASHNQGVWLRIGGDTSQRSGVDGQDFSGNTYRIHLGGDVMNIADGGKGNILVGLMGQQSKNRNEAKVHGLKADGSVSGYSLGLYGTWYADHNSREGAYMDSWIMSGKFDNSVSGQGLSTEKYNSRDTALSLESGYNVSVYRSEIATIHLEPQLQVIYSDYRADTHKEQNGTVVSDQSERSATTRLGLRVSGDIKNRYTDNLVLFAETNWWHGPDSQSIKFDGQTVKDELPSERLEGKVGVSGSLNKSVSLWSSVGFEKGAKDYAAGTAQVGVKYSW